MVELDVGWTGDIVDALASTVTPARNGSHSRNSANGTACGGRGTRGGAAPGVAAEGAGCGGSGGGGPSGIGATGDGTDAAEADWVSFNTQRADEGWRWYAVRNWPNSSDGAAAAAGVWRSYRHAARASVRLLRALAAEMRRGRVMSDEALAPTVCARSEGWCVIDAGWQPGHPVIGTRPGPLKTGEAAEPLYRWESEIDPDLWGEIVAADAAARAADPKCRAEGGGGGGPRAGCSRLYHKLKW